MRRKGSLGSPNPSYTAYGIGPDDGSHRVRRKVQVAVGKRWPRLPWPVAGLLGIVILLGSACGVPTPSSGAVTIPPDSAPAAVVLDAYLRALQAGECDTAAQLTVPLLFSDGGRDLCDATRVSSFSVRGGPTVLSRSRVAFTATLTTTGIAGGLPAGESTWFYILQQQSSEAWRIVDAGIGGFNPSMLPTPPT